MASGAIIIIAIKVRKKTISNGCMPEDITLASACMTATVIPLTSINTIDKIKGEYLDNEAPKEY